MRPHYSQSSRENATPSSGTSPLASYKEVTNPPSPGSTRQDIFQQHMEEKKQQSFREKYSAYIFCKETFYL